VKKGIHDPSRSLESSGMTRRRSAHLDCVVGLPLLRLRTTRWRFNVRKYDARVVGSTGMRPGTAKGRVLAAITFEMLDRKRTTFA
jgi:hypothetical protein